MTLAVWQIIALILVAAGINLDRRGLSLTHARPAIVGLICGLILGDVNSGLYIGGTSVSYTHLDVCKRQLWS